MVGVDLAYNLHSAFGNWFPGIKPLVIQVGVRAGRWGGKRQACSAAASASPRAHRQTVPSPSPHTHTHARATHRRPWPRS